jgi:hypothetical protein
MTGETVICVGCGKLATDRRADAKFCSAACKQASYRGRKEAELEEAERVNAKAKERSDFIASLIA